MVPPFKVAPSANSAGRIKIWCSTCTVKFRPIFLMPGEIPPPNFLCEPRVCRWRHLETRDAYKQFRDRRLQGRVWPIFRVQPKFRWNLGCRWCHLEVVIGQLNIRLRHLQNRGHTKERLSCKRHSMAYFFLVKSKFRRKLPYYGGINYRYTPAIYWLLRKYTPRILDS